MSLADIPEYEIRSGTATSTAHDVLLQWTTEPPTQEGFYWAIDSNGDVEVIKIEEEKDGRIYAYCVNWDVGINPEVYSRFLGPLPEPELPKG